MRRSSPVRTDLEGVFAVPPLARNSDSTRSLNLEESQRIVDHIAGGGITRLLYGGNAFLYHISLDEYAAMLEWAASLSDDLWIIPGAAPSFGRAIDQAPLLRKYGFACVMMLPCSDPRDARGLERGLREIAERAETKLMLYVKDENNLGTDREGGLDALARLVNDGVCAAIKYAVVRKDPGHDTYLEALLTRVDRGIVISGIGERPAVTHMQHWRLPGFTTGSGCIAPALSNRIFRQCVAEEWNAAEVTRSSFLPFEDLRDELGPARVLHSAVELTSIARSGRIPPFVSELTNGEQNRVASVARALLELNAAL
jgi:dihydrodipicolinate synthase/N-acetylneuraminate lyase